MMERTGKLIILIIFSIMTFFSCSDSVFRSRKNVNKRQYPPQKLFKGVQLQAAQKIFDEDNAGLGNIIDTHPEIINQHSEKESPSGDLAGVTLLHYASMLENVKAMEVLLQKGADPDIIDALGGSALSHAVALNNYDMLNLLLKYHATLNPAIGASPLSDAMMLGGFEGTERKMIDYLLKNGADINHISYNGSNIMEDAARDDLKLASYFLEKGGQPKIKGTNLCPMADYIQFEEENQRKFNKTENLNEILAFKKGLIEKYNVQFPYKKDTIAEAKLRMKLYENLSLKDKTSVNFNKNYGENRYQKDLAIVKGQ